jgi:hypothetical protein
MMWQRTLGHPRRHLGPVVLAMLLGASVARGATPDIILQQALQANPLTAPYNLTAMYQNGRLVLSGTVGTKQIHDIAVRTAIALGYSIRDDLVIDTAAAHRVAALQAQAQIQAQAQAQAQLRAPGTMAGAMPGVRIPPLGSGTMPYVYPPPLFGRIDDPFFGFEPPLVSYAPWFGAVTARESALAMGPGGGGVPAGVDAAGNPSTPITVPLGPLPQDGSVQITITPLGAAVVRGPATPATNPDVPPPPPQPAVPPAARPPGAAAAPAPAPPPGPGPNPIPIQPDAGGGGAGPSSIVVDGGDLTDRLSQAFARRPALAGLPIKVTVRDGVATLSGRVPTVYEAMLAFRVVEQTPGIRTVIDRMEFVVPDGERQNPLIRQGRPEDVEPYLTAQIRRNVGDLAHIDRVRMMGDTLEVRGSLVHAEDRPRLDAVLRSMAVLRGFRLEPHFEVECAPGGTTRRTVPGTTRAVLSHR